MDNSFDRLANPELDIALFSYALDPYSITWKVDIPLRDCMASICQTRELSGYKKGMISVIIER